MEPSVRVLLLDTTRKSFWHIQMQLENRGCSCWFACSTAEGAKLLNEYSFDLVLSTIPLQRPNPLLAGADKSHTSIFFCHRVEAGCWWLTLVLKGQKCVDAPAVRASEFAGLLDQMVKEIQVSRRGPATSIPSGPG
jgi:hypothetical protein